MIFRIPALLLILLALASPRPAGGGQTPAAEPRYDPAMTVGVNGVVTETHEVPQGGALHGWHVTIDTGRESLDIYLGPADFMKQFNFTFNKGDRIDVVGSKVKSAGSTVVLAREVRRQNQTVYLRDNAGNPYWPPGS